MSRMPRVWGTELSFTALGILAVIVLDPQPATVRYTRDELHAMSEEGRQVVDDAIDDAVAAGYLVEDGHGLGLAPARAAELEG